MAIINKWLTPYQRSYQQIKSKLIESLSQMKDSNGNNLITDFSEGNILIIILSLFAAIAEVLHYYIDNMGREAFLSTARKYSSVMKHANLVDYHPRGAIASQVDAILSRSITSASLGSQVSIPQGSTFTDVSGNTWLSSRDVIWYANVSTVKVPLIQHELYTTSTLIGQVIPTGDNIQITLGTLPSGKYYENGSMELSIAGESWQLVETFAYSKPTDKHFMVSINENGEPYIEFGDGNFGMKAPSGQQITDVRFYLTKGMNGNIEPNSITSVPSEISGVITDATVNNILAGSGGQNYESFQMLKEHIPLSVKTLGVAITKEDFVNLAKLVPGVSKAKAEYECGRKLNIYINPYMGQGSDSERIKMVKTTLQQKAPLTTWLNVKTAGVVNIMLTIEVTGKKSYKTAEIQRSILQALYNRYSPESSEIGGNVRISDIYSLIDNLEQVDYLYITKFYIKPWPTTLYGNTSLNISSFDIQDAIGTQTYFITFTSSTEYTLRSQYGGFIAEGTVGNVLQVRDTIHGNTFSLGITGTYAQGYRYSLIISEPNMDYEDPGYNIPVFTNANQLNLTVNEIL